MPLYMVSHATPLTPAQLDELAQAITELHTTIFTTPSLFVNVRFAPTSDYVGYVGGRRSRPNSITAHVRHGPARAKEMYNELVIRIAGVWSSIVSPCAFSYLASSFGSDMQGKVKESNDVRIFIMGDIVAGYEHGFTIPDAGCDIEWMRANLSGFEEKARAGNEEMAMLVEEIKSRSLLGEWYLEQKVKG